MKGDNTSGTYTFLRFAQFKDVSFWDYYTLTNQARFHSSFPVVKLSQVLVHRKEFITIDDELEYKRCRVQLYGNGVVLRDVVKGKEIKTKKQQVCKSEDFLVAEIDAKFGGYGIVPKDLEGAIVSSHYFLFTIKQDTLLAEYLSLVVKCDGFAKQVKATGSTNYAAIRPYHVLDYKIPLPAIKIQEELIQHYNNDIATANSHESQAQDLDQIIENYFLSKLGLPPFKVFPRKTGLQIVKYALLERWDFFSGNTKITSELKGAAFSIKNLGSVYNFINRSWNKNEHPQFYFRYVEIGAVNALLGIAEVKEIAVKKAPSRATQVIKTGDLLIATTRPYLKKFVIVQAEFDGCICSSGFSVIEPSSEYNLYFLKEFLMCSYGIEQLKSKMTGALYPAITEGELKDVKIPFPNVEIQNEIMEMVNSKRQEIIHAKEQADMLKEEAIKIFEQAIFQ